jgi:hypothetical protein
LLWYADVGDVVQLVVYVWNVLACTKVVSKGGIEKFFVANSALEGAD